MHNPKFRFVVATRMTREDFFQKSATGSSLSLYKHPSVELDLYDSNTAGLPFIYNKSIEKAKNNPAILIFLHDDVHLCDFYWAEQLLNALNHFDIVGIVGNRRRVKNQTSWAFVDAEKTWDAIENLSGIVGHGNGFPPRFLSAFGPPCQEVKLLDGVFLACHSQLLVQKNLRFDERFGFHFYDLDFCREAEQKGVRMGTWSLSVVHESGGDCSSPQWQVAMGKYFKKWGT